MLTDEQKFENKMKYLELLTHLGVDLTEFTAYLSNINYFEQPANSNYQFSYAGGLCEQALKECHELGVLCGAYFPGKYTEEDIIKVALLRNLYRAEMYEVATRNVKNETTGQWEAVNYFRLKDERPIYGDIAFSSYMISKKFFELSDEQTEAIIQAANVGSYSPDIYMIMQKYPLVTLTKMAEFAANNFDI